ncbi:MAG: glycosyltransferase family 1 protein [Tunicatimonas sp.]
MKLVYINRKKIEVSQSIELYFEQVAHYLPADIRIEQFMVNRRNQGLINRLLNIVAVLKKPKGDVYHVTGDTNYLTILLPKKKTLLTVHDIYYVYYALMSHNPIIRFIKYHLNKWLFYKLPVWRSSLITVNSEFTKKELVRITGCTPKKIVVAYCPISPLFCSYPKVFDDKNPVILQIGVMPNKNLLRLSEALRGIQCRLEIIGDPDEATLLALQSNQIAYACYANLSIENLVQKYVNCDLLVLASTFEGFGMPIIEAQRVGRPVVTSDTAAMPEVAGRGACLVDPYSVDSIRAGIKKVIADASYRESLVEAGTKNCEQYQAHHVAAIYHRTYRQLTNKTT